MPDEFTQQVIAQIEALIGADSKIAIPPKVFLDMQGRFVEYEKARSLRGVFPIFERYEGPSGFMQGGMIAAAFDNIYGPFSYLTTSRYCITLNLNTSYVRPVLTAGKELTIEVRLVDQTKQVLLLEGSAWNAQGKLIAQSTSQMMIVPAPVS